MEFKDCESFRDYKEYYEDLIDYLYDHVPCLDVLISNYNETLRGDVWDILKALSKLY